MSVLQTALLIVGALAVIAVYWFSRRDKNSLKGWSPPSVGAPIKPPSSDQMEMFSRSGEFDEYGVGKPRKRTEPTMPGVPPKVTVADEPAPKDDLRVPAFVAQPKDPEKTVEQKIVAILIAEREGTAILGKKLHTALKQQALVYGDRKIYHRQEMGQTLFSVAGLLKPGQLDPSEADTFSTPGLTLFMVLPGPAKPVYALRNLLSTAKDLAKGLNAELFDAKRQPFTLEFESAMIAEVEDWAQRNA
jgi:FtsZ-interacting cell division protein ZipA